MESEPTYLPTDPAELEQLQLAEMDQLNEEPQPEEPSTEIPERDKIRMEIAQEELTSFLRGFEQRHRVKLGLNITIMPLPPIQNEPKLTEVIKGPAPDVSELPKE